MTTSTSSVTASAGSSILTALGAGSGIDTTTLIAQLVAANKASQQDAITTRTTTNTAKISALATIKSGLDSFTSALQALTSSGQLMTQPNSADTTVAAMSAVSGAQVGDLNANLQVLQLAQSQISEAAAVTDPTTPVGRGTMTLTTPGGSSTITIDSSNDSLNGLAAAVNAAKAGVTASVVQDGTGYRLVLKGTTGAANGFTLTADSGAAAGLSSFTTAAMTQVQAATDAIVKLDGVQVSRASNTISDLVTGAKIVLKGVGTTALTSTRPTAAIEEALDSFVTAYNSLKTALDNTTAAATATTSAGAFNGNATIRTLGQMLTKLTSTKLSGAGTVSTLAELGVSTANDGTLTLDSSRLSATLAADPDGVEAIFNPGQRSSNPLLSITSALGAANPGSYTIANVTPRNGSTAASATIDGAPATASGNTLSAAYGTAGYGLAFTAGGSVSSATITVDLGLYGAVKAIQSALEASTGLIASLQGSLDKETSKITDAQTKLDTASTAYQDQITKQFTAMQTAVASYKSIQSYLTQQVALWSKSD